METVMLWLLIPGLLMEVIIGFLLHDWSGVLQRRREEIDRDSRHCFACITGASVTSFRSQSTGQFCVQHRAHFVLIRDLESRLEKEDEE